MLLQEVSLKEVKEGPGLIAIIGMLTQWNPQEKTALLTQEGLNILLVMNDSFQSTPQENALYRVIGKPFLNNGKLSITVETLHRMQNADLALFSEIRKQENNYLKDVKQ